MDFFISGWAGFKESLVGIPEDWHFINPFIDLDEIEILDFFRDKSGNFVIGWSTGGHIVLKNLRFFSERFKEIIVIAGFRNFTHYVSPRIIKKMILKMQTQPEEVIEEFLIKAGCKTIIPKEVAYEKLMQGLEFLIHSEVSDLYQEAKNVTFIQGLDDKILPLKALEDLKMFYPSAKTFLVKGHHWINFGEIFRIEASDTSLRLLSLINPSVSQ